MQSSSAYDPRYIVNLENIALPDIFYKFLYRKDIKFWTENETVRISSNRYYLEKYRSMEVPDTFIFDPNEGFSIWHQNDDIVTDKVDGNERDAAQFFLKAVAGVSGIPSGVTLRRNIVSFSIPQFHMLCFTHGDLEILKNTFSIKRHDDDVPYDACLEIRNPFELMRRASSGMISEPGQRWSLPFSALFEGVFANYVSYEKKIRSWGEGMPSHSPFVKDMSFSDQREIRMVPKRYSEDGGGLVDQLPDQLDLYVPGLKDFVRVVAL